MKTKLLFGMLLMVSAHALADTALPSGPALNEVTAAGSPALLQISQETCRLVIARGTAVFEQERARVWISPSRFSGPPLFEQKEILRKKILSLSPQQQELLQAFTQGVGSEQTLISFGLEPKKGPGIEINHGGNAQIPLLKYQTDADGYLLESPLIGYLDIDLNALDWAAYKLLGETVSTDLCDRSLDTCTTAKDYLKNHEEVPDDCFQK